MGRGKEAKVKWGSLKAKTSKLQPEIGATTCVIRALLSLQRKSKEFLRMCQRAAKEDFVASGEEQSQTENVLSNVWKEGRKIIADREQWEKLKGGQRHPQGPLSPQLFCIFPVPFPTAASPNGLGMAALESAVMGPNLELATKLHK